MPQIQVYRGDKLESQHDFDALLYGVSGIISVWGNSDRYLFSRSLIKPVQAKVSLDFIRSAGLNLSASQIAIACSSHNAEAEQLAAVDSILRDFAVDKSHITCGYVHNCSGKHSAILAALSASGLDLQYLNPGHEYHQRMALELSRLGLTREAYSCSDGCGLPTYHLSISELAALFQSMICDKAYAEIISAMNSYPFLVGGTKQFDSLLMSNYPNRFIAKSGAEGLMMLANLKLKQVLVLKLRDGAKRAKAYAAYKLARELQWLNDDEANEVAILNATAENTFNAQDHLTGYLKIVL